jgi:hypothetical protein
MRAAVGVLWIQLVEAVLEAAMQHTEHLSLCPRWLIAHLLYLYNHNVLILVVKEHHVDVGADKASRAVWTP